MGGRFTYRLTRARNRQAVSAHPEPARNTQARYNVCPTTTIDTIIGRNGQRELVPMRWGFVPYWWEKSPKELKLATFDARAETVAEKPKFRSAFKRNRCLTPVSGYYEWQDTGAASSPGTSRQPMGRLR